MPDTPLGPSGTEPARHVVVADAPGPRGGGRAMSAELHASMLASLGHQVSLYQISERPSDGTSKSRGRAGRLRAFRVSASHLPLDQIAQSANLVHLNGHWRPVNHELATRCRAAGTRYLISSRGEASGVEAYQHSDRARRRMAEAERAYVDGAAAIHTTSRLEYRRARADVRRRPSVLIPNSIAVPRSIRDLPRETARSVLGLPPLHRILLYYGRVVPEKNPLWCLRVLQKLPDDVHLFVVGTAGSADRKLVDREARQRSINRRVTVIPFEVGTDAMRWLRAADVLLVPSHFENFCRAAAEAAACGLPTVTSPSVGINEYLPGSIHRVADLDVDRWVAAVCNLMGAPRTGPQRVPLAFDPSNVSRAWEDYLSSVPTEFWSGGAIRGKRPT